MTQRIPSALSSFSLLALLAMLSFNSLAADATTEAASTAASTGATLAQVIAGRSDEDKSRDSQRHPQETLSFFQVQPGMTLAEALPGQGWYTRILAPYLGGKATLHGINYPDSLWPLMGIFNDQMIKERIAVTKKFPGMVGAITDNGISTTGFTFNTVPSEVLGKVDRVLLIRTLHNLNRFEAQTGMRSQALSAVRAMLKPDGLVGVVQHRAPESADAAFSDGSHGYLKQSDVIAFFTKAGFELVASNEINANPKDQPGPEDIVWRLPPSLSGSEDNPELKAAMTAIGESDRMTLLFRKSAD